MVPQHSVYLCASLRDVAINRSDAEIHRVPQRIALLLVLMTCWRRLRALRMPLKKVLVLYWESKDFVGNISFDKGFQAGLFQIHRASGAFQ